MRCHDILGISERASEAEIHAALEHKINTLNEATCIGELAREKKLAELNVAKEECMSWRHKSFPARTTSRLTEYTEAKLAKNRLNSEVCIGPCSCVDVCAGMSCTCDSSNRSFCVDGCGCDCLGLSPAVFCDATIYIAAIVGFAIAYASDQNEKKRKKEAEDRERQIEKSKANIAALQAKLAECKMQLEELQQENERLKCKAAALESFICFFRELSNKIDMTAIEKFLEQFDWQIRDNEEKITQQHGLELSLQLKIREESKKIDQ